MDDETRGVLIGPAYGNASLRDARADDSLRVGRFFMAAVGAVLGAGLAVELGVGAGVAAVAGGAAGLAMVPVIALVFEVLFDLLVYVSATVILIVIASGLFG